MRGRIREREKMCEREKVTERMIEKLREKFVRESRRKRR